jgi:hypothetical protein
LLREQPELVDAQIIGRRGGYRTPLHVVADWPDYFPNGPAMVRLLLAHGAHPDRGAEGFGRGETPLHWAASSDAVEAPSGSIADGSPLDNPVGYGCGRVARLLVQRSARVQKLWHAAGLGVPARVEELLDGANHR